MCHPRVKIQFQIYLGLYCTRQHCVLFLINNKIIRSYNNTDWTRCILSFAFIISLASLAKWSRFVCYLWLLDFCLFLLCTNEPLSCTRLPLNYKDREFDFQLSAIVMCFFSYTASKHIILMTWLLYIFPWWIWVLMFDKKLESGFTKFRKLANMFRNGYCYYYLGTLFINIQSAEAFEVGLQTVY